MAIPTLISVAPQSGPSSGGDLLRLGGQNFGVFVRVRIGGALASIVSLRIEAGVDVVDVRTPVHEPGMCDIELQNLDEQGAPIAGEVATLTSRYQFLRPPLVPESNLTRAIRKLLQELKRQTLLTVSATVSVDYDDTPGDGLDLIALAKIPSLVLSGPTLRPNRFYSQNQLQEDVIAGTNGPEVVRRKPPVTYDLAFSVTGASERTAELFNLMAAVATFFNRNRWLELARDPSRPALGTVRWELDAEGDMQTVLNAEKNDVRAFRAAFLVRGFDVDEGLPLDVAALVAEGASADVRPGAGGQS